MIDHCILNRNNKVKKMTVHFLSIQFESNFLKYIKYGNEKNCKGMDLFKFLNTKEHINRNRLIFSFLVQFSKLEKSLYQGKYIFYLIIIHRLIV